MTSNHKTTHDISTVLALDDLADLCEHWKLVRQKHRTPGPLRLAILKSAQEAVDCDGEIKRLTAERDALRAELEALRGQDPALYVQSNHFANAKVAPFLARICQQPLSQIHTVPLYLAAGAQRVPAGWQLVPKTITAKMEAVYSNDSGAYQAAQALHDAMLAAAPKPEDNQ